MYDRGYNDTGCFGIKIRTDTVKLTNVIIAKFRQCRDLVRECEMFIEYEAKVTSREFLCNLASLADYTVVCIDKERCRQALWQHACSSPLSMRMRIHLLHCAQCEVGEAVGARSARQLAAACKHKHVISVIFVTFLTSGVL